MAENHAMNLNRNKHRLVTIRYLHRRGGFFQFYVFWPIRSKLAAGKLRAHLFSGLRSLGMSRARVRRGEERRGEQDKAPRRSPSERLSQTGEMLGEMLAGGVTRGRLLGARPWRYKGCSAVAPPSQSGKKRCNWDTARYARK